jgi:hypothetical protein
MNTVSQFSLEKNHILEYLIYATVLIAAYYIYLMPIFGDNFQFIPGNLGDSRLNNYFLEHAYRWFIGLEDNFWSAPFFYPAQNVMSYSDNHLGSFLIYAAARLLNFSREDSYQIWFLIGIALNYVSMIILLKYYKFNKLAVVSTFLSLSF